MGMGKEAESQIRALGAPVGVRIDGARATTTKN